MQTCTYENCTRKVKLAGDVPLCYHHKPRQVKIPVMCETCNNKLTTHYSRQCMKCRDLPERVLMAVSKEERQMIYNLRNAPKKTADAERCDRVVKEFEHDAASEPVPK